MTEDISRKAIVILLVLVILVSMIGTWVVLDATSGLSARPVQQTTSISHQARTITKEPQTSGKVVFSIVGPNSSKEEKNG